MSYKRLLKRMARHAAEGADYQHVRYREHTFSMVKIAAGWRGTARLPGSYNPDFALTERTPRLLAKRLIAEMEKAK